MCRSIIRQDLFCNTGLFVFNQVRCAYNIGSLYVVVNFVINCIYTPIKYFVKFKQIHASFINYMFYVFGENGGHSSWIIPKCLM